MSKTITYYSVAESQAALMIRNLEESGSTVEPIDGDPYSASVVGKTIFGDVKGKYTYSKASGQLTVEITDHPFVVTIHTIDADIKKALAEAAATIAKESNAVEPPPIPAIEPTPAPADTNPAVPSEPQPSQD